MAANTQEFILKGGQKLMRLMLAHYDREEGVRPFQVVGCIRDAEGRCGLEHRIQFDVTGSDLVEREYLHPCGVRVQAGAWNIRGRIFGTNRKVEGYYDPQLRCGVLSVEQEDVGVPA